MNTIVDTLAVHSPLLGFSKNKAIFIRLGTDTEPEKTKCWFRIKLNLNDLANVVNICDFTLLG